MRRSGPRPLAAALAQLRGDVEPATVLARVQACWAQVVGPAIAAEAEPVREGGGVLTVACGSAAWAQELQLLRADVLAGLTEALEEAGAAPLTELRVRVGGGPS